MSPDRARWRYRFDNFKRAYFLLQEAAERVEALSQLEREGLVQRFEYCTELAWKTVYNYLESENVLFAQITPRAVVKEGIAVGVLTDGQTWLDMLDARNRMSHTYSFESFQRTSYDIVHRYMACFQELYEKLASIITDGE